MVGLEYQPLGHVLFIRGDYERFSSFFVIHFLPASHNVLCGTRCASAYFAVHADSSNSSNLSAAIAKKSLLPQSFVALTGFASYKRSRARLTHDRNSHFSHTWIPQDRADVANHLEELLGAAPVVYNVNLASGASRAR